MAAQYFSDREGGPKPRTLDELPEGAWKGLVAAFSRGFDRNLFAEDFPMQCPDGAGIYGTSEVNMAHSIAGQIPDLEGFPVANDCPGTDVAMDLVEFAWQHASSPKVKGRHSYFNHDHLGFDRGKGRSEWRDEVNLILRRHGVRLEITDVGRVERIGSLPAQTLLETPMPPSGDEKLDTLLSTAIGKYQDRRIQTRREALEQLWDALERVKTVLDVDKKRGVAALIQRMASSDELRDLINEEFRNLTDIGNTFEIRHHETDKHQVPEAMVDYLFVRALALIDLAVRAISPVAEENEL